MADDSDEDYAPLPGMVWMEGDSLAPPCQSDLDLIPHVCVCVCVYVPYTLLANPLITHPPTHTHTHKSKNKQIISLASITDTDTFLDLGCGDGRVCIEVAKHTHCQAIGVEIEAHLIEKFKKRVAKETPPLKEGQVCVCAGDLLEEREGLGEEVSVMYLYLLPEGIEKVWPMVRGWLKERARKRRRRMGAEVGKRGAGGAAATAGADDGGRQRETDTHIHPPSPPLPPPLRIICNMWGLPGREAKEKRDVGHLNNVRLLLYTSEEEEEVEGEGERAGGEIKNNKVIK
jgi:SAM-dependent methyltransferase